MAFQIVEIIDVQAERTFAKVSHGGNQFNVSIRGHNSNDLIVGKSVQAEIDYDEVVEWKELEDFNDDQSGIWQEQDEIHLVGRIHNVLDYGDGKTIVDVYMQKGPEYFTVTSDAMEDLSFDVSSGLEIVVKNLYLHPTS